MKELRVAPYDRDAPASELPDSVQAVTALRFGLFPEGVALFRFQGDKDFVRNLRQAKQALNSAFSVEREGGSVRWTSKSHGLVVRMDHAHHAALVEALNQAFRQGLPSTLMDSMDMAVDWLAGASDVDPNKLPGKKAK